MEPNLVDIMRDMNIIGEPDTCYDDKVISGEDYCDHSRNQLRPDQTSTAGAPGYLDPTRYVRTFYIALYEICGLLTTRIKLFVFTCFWRTAEIAIFIIEIECVFVYYCAFVHHAITV
jgi:hypothetical protein